MWATYHNGAHISLRESDPAAQAELPQGRQAAQNSSYQVLARTGDIVVAAPTYVEFPKPRSRYSSRNATCGGKSFANVGRYMAMCNASLASRVVSAVHLSIIARSCAGPKLRLSSLRCVERGEVVHHRRESGFV